MDFSDLGFFFDLLEFFRLRIFQKRHEDSKDTSICLALGIIFI